jgi:hypothetical protein
MKHHNYQPIVETSEFGKFANFFIMYLNGSSSMDEAFIRARSRYRRLFKTVPYTNSKRFLTDFYRAQHN